MVPALTALARETASSGVQAAVRAEQVPDAIPPDVTLCLYRVAQEALTNVIKHAHATRVDVVLEGNREAVTLVIEDDGVGFDAAANKTLTGIGLVGMRERAALIGAALQVESTAGKGTTIYLRYPKAQK